MRRLHIVHEFKDEAPNALFTKKQAVAVTMQLLEKEKNCPENTEKENQILTDAIEKAEFRYLDQTATDTDKMLDSLEVARLTPNDIVNAIDALLFDVQ